MRTVVFSTAMIAGVVLLGIAPAKAAFPTVPGIGNTNFQIATVERVGFRRRFYRRYVYPMPYAYYPPAYGYYVPPSAYAYAPTGYSLAGAYADAPPPDGHYIDAPPPGGAYADAPLPGGAYADAPPDGEYPDAPLPGGY